MRSMVFQKSAAGIAVGYAPPFLVGRLLTRRKPLRLRRKLPPWTGLALLVLVADILMAVFAWIAVDFVLN
ncbi:hypothetical protein E4K65_12410 [Bradyrhizobium niftali]|jgi:hypothetical protein|uniref:Uncharacterized protein n=1 Tax=Bradyrhizobium niftali TaxID=2560055 RepID=A0A4Y9LZD3_9BRAD|nr:hypothetical protein E4K65_12410 [Bradyrhizobium niftali]